MQDEATTIQPLFNTNKSQRSQADSGHSDTQSEPKGLCLKQVKGKQTIWPTITVHVIHRYHARLVSHQSENKKTKWSPVLHQNGLIP